MPRVYKKEGEGPLYTTTMAYCALKRIPSLVRLKRYLCCKASLTNSSSDECRRRKVKCTIPASNPTPPPLPAHDAHLLTTHQQATRSVLSAAAVPETAPFVPAQTPKPSSLIPPPPLTLPALPAPSSPQPHARPSSSRASRPSSTTTSPPSPRGTTWVIRRGTSPPPFHGLRSMSRCYLAV